jgi:hypothetical protein
MCLWICARLSLAVYETTIPLNVTPIYFLSNTPLQSAYGMCETDVKEASVDLADETLKFKGKSESKEYEVDIAFLKPVDSKGSTFNVLPRSVVMHVMKKDKEEEEFWPRLLKDKALEKNQVKIDWDRYVDEDEEEEGFDTSAVSSFEMLRCLDTQFFFSVLPLF